MAKRKNTSVDDQPEENGTEEEQSEVVDVSLDTPVDTTAPIGEIDGTPVFITEAKSGIAAPTPVLSGHRALPANEDMYNVAFTLPRSVLAALLDPTNPIADVPGAEAYGLLYKGELTAIGEKVLAGFDQTAVRHKMNAVWRIAHNAQVDKGK